MSDNWPKRPDGSNKKIGEMSAEERSEVFRTALVSLGNKIVRSGEIESFTEHPRKS